MFLDNVEPGYVNTQGTNLASAIELSMGSFEVSEDFEKENNKAIIIITDGEDHEPGAVEIAKEAKEMGIKVYTIGIGSPKGAPIPIYKHGIRTDYKRDKSGTTIITKLNEENLKNIAQSGDGIYVRATNSKTGLKDIFNEISKMNQQEIEAKVFKEYNDKFYLFLGLALIFFLIEAFITEKKSKYFKFFNI
jgi:Ca-activated chloride channel family protein